MRAVKPLAAASCAVLFLAVGCQSQQAHRQPAPKAAFKTALDTYYQAHPSCLWSTAKPLPIDLDVYHPDKVLEQQLDALEKAGLLERKVGDQEVPAEDHHPRHRERVYEYNLTDKGKADWTASSAGPSGAGNFCIGSPNVVSVETAVPAPTTSRYSVSYHYTVGPLPDWAKSADVQAAFPTLTAESGDKKITSIATLSKTANGWMASGVQPIVIAPPPKAS